MCEESSMGNTNFNVLVDSELFMKWFNNNFYVLWTASLEAVLGGNAELFVSKNCLTINALRPFLHPSPGGRAWVKPCMAPTFGLLYLTRLKKLLEFVQVLIVFFIIVSDESAVHGALVAGIHLAFAVTHQFLSTSSACKSNWMIEREPGGLTFHL